MFNKILKADLIRYSDRPVFWSAVFGATMGLIYKMWMDLLCERHDV